jgi:hypothetical protein
VLPNSKGFLNFLKNFKLPALSLLISILSKVLQSSNLFSFFPPSTKTNHSSPPKESYRNKYFQDLNRKLCLENRALNDPNSPFKEKEKEGGERRSQLGGQWKVQLLGGP